MQPFRIGDFTVEPARNLVSGPQGTVSIEPKIMDVLCALAEKPGAVWSRSELIDRVWGREYGADESLTRAVSQLRKVFGDTRDEARLLETIPKRGYRLIAPVSGAEFGTTEPAPPSRKRFLRTTLIAAGLIVAALLAGFLLWPTPSQSPAAPVANGIAVTVGPLGNRAMAEALAANLSHEPLFRVRVAGDAGKEEPTRLRYRIVGSFGPDGAGIQIVDAESGEHLWARSFARDGRSDAEFLRTVSAALYSPILVDAKKRLRARPINTLSPWELTLIATWVPGSDDVFLAPHTRDAFWVHKRAVALDPGYAPAHALWADQMAYHALFNPAEDTAAAHAAADRQAMIALADAPYDADVLFEIAAYDRNIGKRDAAVAMLKRVLALRPDHPVAAIDLAFIQGMCSADSAAAIDRLHGLDRDLSPADPVHWVVLSHLADLHLARGEYADARRDAAAARQIVKQTWSNITLAAAAAALGDSAEAGRVAAEARLEWPALDYGHFADALVPRWCLNGPQTAPARAAFHKLQADISRTSALPQDTSP